MLEAWSKLGYLSIWGWLFSDAKDTADKEGLQWVTW